MPKDSPVLESAKATSCRAQRIDETHSTRENMNATTHKKHANNNFEETDEPRSTLINDCMHTASILLEPSEYFFDDDFAIPFDANLRDESSGRRLPLEESDEGISSSGTINRGLKAPALTRSDSCLFSQPDSGSSAQDGQDSESGQRFESLQNAPTNSVSHVPPKKLVCSPDSTSNNLIVKMTPRIRRTVSADFSTALYEIIDGEKLFDNGEIGFGDFPQAGLNDPTSVTTSWMKAVLEGSSCPQLKELLKRTTEALDYRLAWGDLQLGVEECAVLGTCITSPRNGRLHRSTSHGNILTAASLAGMRQALANIRAVATTTPKQFRSVGVSTSENERSCDEVSLPDTTTTTATTTWARIRTSRESLNGKRSNPPSDATVIPPPPPPGIPESAMKWRAVKEVASNELTTWGQLHRAASLGTRRGHKEHVAKRVIPAHMHASLMSPDFDIPLVTRKAMHRYSGTLLEIFMRARAHDLISSSCSSSVITSTIADGPPRILKQLGPSIARDVNRSMSTRSLQTNASILSIGTETEHTPIGAIKRPTATFFKLGIPPLKSSVQPPPEVPPRRSSFVSPQHLPFGNRFGGIAACLDRPLCAMPPMSLLTMSADPESECMSRLRDGPSLTYVKNPRAAIVYPGLGQLAIPKPSRMESNTFLSQTLPDLSLLGKAAAQEAKSGTPTTHVQQTHSGRRSVSVAAVNRRQLSAGTSGNRIVPRNGRIYDKDALQRRMSGADSLLQHRPPAVAVTRKNVHSVS